MPGPVEVSSEGELALVTLSRLERRNALDAGAAQALAVAVTEAGASHRVLIVTGGPDAFCSGGDLEELDRFSQAPQDEVAQRLYGSFQALIRAVRATDAVVIAAVGGAAVGAGMDLALACDLRLAAANARFGQVWVRLGLIPGTGGAFLTPHVIGLGAAAHLLLTGELIDAAEALRLGLVSKVVPPERLLDEARGLAALVLAHPRDGVVANKRALVAASEAALEAALEHARRVQPARFASEEFKAALRAARRR
jgi:enoyl-CoA hydratase/carnithine racemase